MPPPPLPVPPTLPGAPSGAKLKREICVFFVFLAVLLVLAGYWSLTSLVGKPPILGLARHLALGIPTLAIAAAHGLAGFLVMLGFHRTGVVVGSVAAVALALLYFAIMGLSTGDLPINLVTLVVVAIPVLVIQRSMAFLRLRPAPSP